MTGNTLKNWLNIIMVVAQAVPVADDNTDILQHIRVLLHISDRYEYISDGFFF